LIELPYYAGCRYVGFKAGENQRVNIYSLD
jgi:hypothetical protein